MASSGKTYPCQNNTPTSGFNIISNATGKFASFVMMWMKNGKQTIIFEKNNERKRNAMK